VSSLKTVFIDFNHASALFFAVACGVRYHFIGESEEMEERRNSSLHWRSRLCTSVIQHCRKSKYFDSVLPNQKTIML
jgi:hypothetical protein